MKRVCNYKGHIKISLSDNTHRLNFLKIGARAGSKAAQLVIVAVAVQQPLRRQPVHIARYALRGARVGHVHMAVQAALVKHPQDFDGAPHGFLNRLFPRRTHAFTPRFGLSPR